MKKLLLSLSLALMSMSAIADETCDGGTLLQGIVQTTPSFKRGRAREGIYLSHTHLTLQGTDGQMYDVAMDNVFANGYQENKGSVPYPLNQIQIGDQLQLCGELYSGGDVGIHWVHTNCGDPATATEPNGWVKDLSQTGLGDNLEGNETYCYLWQ